MENIENIQQIPNNQNKKQSVSDDFPQNSVSSETPKKTLDQKAKPAYSARHVPLAV